MIAKRMQTGIVLAVLGVVMACGSDPHGPSSNDGGGTDASGTDDASGTPDSSTTRDTGTLDTGAMCSQPGATGCDTIVGAACARTIQCCTSGGSCTCTASYCTLTACKAAYLTAGYNCASTRYASKTVCAEKTSACVNDVPLMACSDLLGGTANWPATCNTFWAQFP